MVEIYNNFGVETIFNNDNSITISKTSNLKLDSSECELAKQTLNFELNNCPDIAQTIAVTCFGLGIGCHLTGLHTLKIKETDRLEALKNELTKLGANVSVTNDSLTLEPSEKINENINSVRRELFNLEDMGLLVSRKAGNLKYFRVNKDFYLYIIASYFWI